MRCIERLGPREPRSRIRVDTSTANSTCAPPPRSNRRTTLTKNQASRRLPDKAPDRNKSQADSSPWLGFAFLWLRVSTMRPTSGLAPHRVRDTPSRRGRHPARRSAQPARRSGRTRPGIHRPGVVLANATRTAHIAFATDGRRRKPEMLRRQIGTRLDGSHDQRRSIGANHEPSIERRRRSANVRLIKLAVLDINPAEKVAGLIPHPRVGLKILRAEGGGDAGSRSAEARHRHARPAARRHGIQGEHVTRLNVSDDPRHRRRGLLR